MKARMRQSGFGAFCLAVGIGAVFPAAIQAAAGAAAIHAAPGASGWMPPFAPVEGRALEQFQTFLRTDGPVGLELLRRMPALRIVKAFNPDFEAHRRFAAALGLSSNFDAEDVKRDYDDNEEADPAKTSLYRIGRSVVAALEKGQLAEIVQSRATAVAAAVDEGRMGVEALDKAAAELAPFAFYPDQELAAKVKAVQEMARQARLDRTMEAARGIAATLLQDKVLGELGELREYVERVQVPARKSGPAQHPAGEIAAVKNLIGKLGRVDYPAGTLNQLRAKALGSGDEAVQRAVARGLVQNLHLEYHDGLRVSDALEDIARVTPFEGVRIIVIRGLMGEVSKNTKQAESLIYRVGYLAEDLVGKRVKDEAVALLRGELDKARDEGRKRLIRSRLDRIEGRIRKESPEDYIGSGTHIASVSADPKIPVKTSDPATPPAQVALWGIVEITDDGGAGIPAQAQEIIAVQQRSTGWLWWKRRFATYMVNVAPGDVDRFTAAGFSPIKELRIRLSWSRVSDINGWGTEVNGEVHRNAYMDLDFSGQDLAAAFKLLRDFEADPLAVLRRYPKEERWVRARGPVASFERGYIVASSINVQTGSALTKDGKVLFENGHSSGYYR